MRFALPFLTLLLLALPAWATPQVPEQKIVGAEAPLPLGDMADLSVTPPGDVPGLLGTTYEWKLFDLVVGKDGLVEPVAKKFKSDHKGGIFFGTGITPKRMLAVVAVTHLFEADKDGKKTVVAKTVELWAKLTVGSDSPAPQPAPTPNPIPIPQPPDPAPSPGPAPTFSDGKFKGARDAYAFAKQRVDAAGLAKAKDAATAFRGVAGVIQKGGLKGVKNILDSTSATLDKALGDQAAAWEGWGDWLQERLVALYQGGTFQSDADFATYFIEVAEGLEAVK
jgi:hypothetical protein